MYAAVYPVVASNTHHQAHCYMTSLGGSALGPAYRSKDARKTKENNGRAWFFLKSVFRSCDVPPNFEVGKVYSGSTADPVFRR
jgi:hypothetical protein